MCSLLKTTVNTAVNISHYEEHLSVLKEILKDQWQSKLHIDVVLDPLSLDNEEKQKFFQDFFDAGDNKYYPLFMSSPFEHLRAISPYLCRITAKDNGFDTPFFMNLLIRIFDRPELGFFAVSSVSFDEAVQHWQSLLESELPDGNLTHLRVYNSEVIARLLLVCTLTEQGRLLGPYTDIFVVCSQEIKEELSEKFPLDTQVQQNSKKQNELIRGQGSWMHFRHPSLETLIATKLSKKTPENMADKLAEKWRIWVKNAKEILLTAHTIRNKLGLPLFLFTERHLSAFKNSMTKVTQANLVKKLWQEDAEATLKLLSVYEKVLKPLSENTTQNNQSKNIKIEGLDPLENFVALVWKEGENYGLSLPELKEYVHLLARHYEHPVLAKQRNEIMLALSGSAVENFRYLQSMVCPPNKLDKQL